MPELFAQSDKVSPFHVASPNKPQNLLCSKRGQAIQVLPINTIFFEDRLVGSKANLIQPHPYILGRPDEEVQGFRRPSFTH